LRDKSSKEGSGERDSEARKKNTALKAVDVRVQGTENANDFEGKRGELQPCQGEV